MSRADEALGSLENEWSRLEREWKRVSALWKDVVQQEFANQYWSDFEAVTQHYVQQLREMSEVINQSKRSVA